MQLAKYWRIKIQGCCWPRCRDTWKPFRWFRCSKRWSWLKAALFNFAMWGCGADLQSSVIWSYPRSTIPRSSTPSPSRYGTRLFTASQYSLFSIFFHVYLVWCQVQNHGNESRDCHSQISIVKKFRTEYIDTPHHSPPTDGWLHNERQFSSKKFDPRPRLGVVSGEFRCKTV